jgi:hypothetical protein
MRHTNRMLTAMRTLAVCVALLPSGLAAQESARQRAERALPPRVFEELAELARRSSAGGIPEEPLFGKALEGVAKRVPPDRLLPAVRSYAERLGDARSALGTGAGVSLLVAGADALQRGVPADALRALDSERARSPMAVLVLAELVEAGVSTDRALAMLREAMALRARDEQILDIPARVRRLIRDGRAPHDAAERVRRTLGRDPGRRIGPPVPPGSEPVRDVRRVSGR